MTTKKASTPSRGGTTVCEMTPPPSCTAPLPGLAKEIPPPVKISEAEREDPYHPCVGCGYCCLKAQCWFSIDCYGDVDGVCPSLYHNGERFRCAQVGSERLRELVAIGAGCCSPLNSKRRRQIFCDLLRAETPSPG